MSQTSTARAPLVVVMGASGAGKTRIGSELAARLGLSYVDGDALHPAENIAQMAAGIPLTDDHRRPWLEAVGAFLAAHADEGAVTSCSALRRAYRDVLTRAAPSLVFLHLTGDPALLASRIAARTGHFMPASLLASQLALLEPLQLDEPGLALDVRATPGEIVERFVAWLASRGSS